MKIEKPMVDLPEETPEDKPEELPTNLIIKNEDVIDHQSENLREETTEDQPEELPNNLVIKTKDCLTTWTRSKPNCIDNWYEANKKTEIATLRQ